MKILLFGVTNVGKTETGKVLAKKLGYRFFDLDEEIKKELAMTLEEFVQTEDTQWRDRKRGRIIKRLLKEEDDFVLAVTPITYYMSFVSRIHAEDVLNVELVDSAEHIFERLVFSDENDRVYKDDAYKNKYKQYYLREIGKDQFAYGVTNRLMGIKNQLDMNNDPPGVVADRLIREFVNS